MTLMVKWLQKSNGSKIKGIRFGSSQKPLLKHRKKNGAELKEWLFLTNEFTGAQKRVVDNSERKEVGRER